MTTDSKSPSYRVTLNKLSSEATSTSTSTSSLLSECHTRCATRTLRVLEANGSIFIKLGQHLSSLTYLLPPEWTSAFTPLQDRCPVSSFSSISDLFLSDTGQPLSSLFSDFSPTPIASASLAQVHLATYIPTGQRVAVKVQHPDLAQWVPLDLALTRLTFSTLRRFFPEYDLSWLSEEMETSLPLELDFTVEAHNATRLASHFRDHASEPALVIPEVIWAQPRILVMSYIPGARPDDLAYLERHHIDRDDVSASLSRIFNEMIFGEGAPLHCDPHAGNIAIRPRSPHNQNGSDRGRGPNFDVILYDHGLYRDIPLALKRSYAKLWLAVIDGDETRMRRYAREVGGVDDTMFPLFASAITGRDYTILSTPGAVTTHVRTTQERDDISNALLAGPPAAGEASAPLLPQLVQMLASLPRILLLVLKTNDLTRSLDEGLHTTRPERTWLILARYCARTVWREEMEGATGVKGWWRVLRAWWNWKSTSLKLDVYETMLTLRRGLGMT